jgi:molecular chaperone DnaK (HSP70)
VILLDVAPLSLGIEIKGGLMSTIIKRNTNIPAKKSCRYETSENNQTTVVVSIYEGERAMTKDNILLGSFELNGLRPAPAGQTKLDVSFDLDANGILNVSATSADQKEMIEIVNEKGRLTQQQIQEMIQTAQDFAKWDALARARIEAKNSWDSQVSDIQDSLAKLSLHISAANQSKVLSKIQAVDEWYSSNPAKVSVKELSAHQETLADIWDPIHLAASRSARVKRNQAPPPEPGNASSSSTASDVPVASKSSSSSVPVVAASSSVSSGSAAVAQKKKAVIQEID